MFREKHSEVMFSQDFGVQSASQDSSMGVFATFQRTHNQKNQYTDLLSQEPPIFNKKSDWTMDMPKIEYQPEQVDSDASAEEEDEATDMQQLEQLDDNEFLSDESKDNIQDSDEKH